MCSTRLAGGPAPIMATVQNLNGLLCISRHEWHSEAADSALVQPRAPGVVGRAAKNCEMTCRFDSTCLNLNGLASRDMSVTAKQLKACSCSHP